MRRPFVAPAKVDSNAGNAIGQEHRRDRNEPDSQSGIAAISNKAAEEKTQRKKNSSPDQAERSRAALWQALGARGQTSGNIDQGERGAVGMCESKHEAAHVVPNIDIPADLEAVQNFQHTA